MKYRTLLVTAALVAGRPAAAPAQVPLFTDNFDTTPASNYNVNVSQSTAGYAAATFGFDYSTLGIPSAPHSVGGTTIGLKLEANKIVGSGVVGGINVSPLVSPIPAGLTRYTLQFDLWQNFNGPFPDGGTGSTQHSGGGFGTDGVTPLFPGTPAATGIVQGVTFAADGDGGASGTSTTVRDYVAYKNPAAFTATGITYAASSGTPQDNADPHYMGFGNIPAPAAQVALFPQQGQTSSGATAPNTAVGAPGMAWHTWQITRDGNTVTWTMDSLLIATVDISDKTFAGTNFFLGHFDFFASVAPVADQPVLFGLFDNVTVTTPVPEPSCSLAIVALAAPVVLRLRRRRPS